MQPDLVDERVPHSAHLIARKASVRGCSHESAHGFHLVLVGGRKGSSQWSPHRQEGLSVGVDAGVPKVLRPIAWKAFLDTKVRVYGADILGTCPDVPTAQDMRKPNVKKAACGSQELSELRGLNKHAHASPLSAQCMIYSGCVTRRVPHGHIYLLPHTSRSHLLSLFRCNVDFCTYASSLALCTVTLLLCHCSVFYTMCVCTSPESPCPSVTAVSSHHVLSHRVCMPLSSQCAASLATTQRWSTVLWGIWPTVSSCHRTRSGTMQRATCSSCVALAADVHEVEGLGMREL
eukprot:873337-Pelagomonas_calceolata.AAC.1